MAILVSSCQWCEQKWRQVKMIFSSPYHILRLDKTFLKFSVAVCLELSPILFSLLTWTRQDSLVLSVSAVWTSWYTANDTVWLYKVNVVYFVEYGQSSWRLYVKWWLLADIQNNTESWCWLGCCLCLWVGFLSCSVFSWTLQFHCNVPLFSWYLVCLSVCLSIYHL